MRVDVECSAEHFRHALTAPGSGAALSPLLDGLVLNEMTLKSLLSVFVSIPTVSSDVSCCFVVIVGQPH